MMTNGKLKEILKFQSHIEKFYAQRIPEIQRMAEQARKTQDYLKPAIDAVERFYAEAEEQAIKSYRLFKSMEESAKAWDKVKRICLELGWFPCGQWGPEAGKIILRLYKEGKIEQLDKEICDFYCERLLDIVDDWDAYENLDKRRLKIIKQAIVAHLNEYYEMSTIVLFSQIEGQIRDRLIIKGRTTYPKLLKKYKRSINHGKDKVLIKEAYVDIIFSSMLEKLFKRHGPELTRHGAVHGFYLEPFDRIKSMKLILLLNFVITTNIWMP